MPKLTLTDIADIREYERGRDEFRRHIIDLKKRRRVHVGPFVTLMFENTDTIRFQIQEMARVERINSDEGIQTELDIYNPLIPPVGQLAATLFVELTSDEELREWLPKLVGIETAPVLRIDDTAVACRVDEDHAKQLTREEVTASVHYVHFDVPVELADALEAGPAVLALDHPEYQHETELGPETRAELAATVRHGG